MNNTRKDFERESPPTSPQDDWEKTTIAFMESRGWANDINDENTLGFSFYEGEHHWIIIIKKLGHLFITMEI